MEREERADLVNSQEPKTLDERDKTLATPNFDENSIHYARPAVPLAHEARTARSLPLIALAVAAGLIGGIVGIFALNFYERRGAQPQPAQTNATTNASRDDEQRAPAQQTQPAATNDITSAQTNNAHTNANAPLPNDSAMRSDRAADAGATTKAQSDNATAPSDERSAQSNQQQRVAGADETQELRAAFGEWITATNARDIDRQMKFYEPRIGAYYLSRNASREAVRAEKEHVFARASAVDVRAGDPEITLSPDGQTAAMRFRKDYTIAGDGFDKRGAVIQELRWRRTPKGWRITSERDLRVVP
jgi:ketosteroid isomerase-like protein